MFRDSSSRGRLAAVVACLAVGGTGVAAAVAGGGTVLARGMLLATSTDPSGVGAADPDTLPAGTQTLLTLTVSPGTDPISTGMIVTGNLSPIGGAPTQRFSDDGLDGDVTAGDNVFSYLATVGPTVTAGAKTIPVALQDAQGRNATASIALTVAVGLGSPAVVISEFRVRGPNGPADEFIELYNRSVAPMDVGGWLLKGSNGAGSVAIRATIPSGTLLAPNCHYLLTNTAGPYSGSVPGDQTYSLQIPDDGGLAVTLPDGTIADQVGMSNGSAFKEGSPLFNLGTSNVDRGWERIPGGSSGSGTDTNDNSFDFRVHSPTDPQNLSSPCSTPPPPPSDLFGVGHADPETVPAGTQILLTVAVDPARDPTSTGITVRGDVTAIGGAANQPFLDDGLDGDVTAGDRVFSYLATVDQTVLPGAKTLPVAISDAENRSGAALIPLSVVLSLSIDDVSVQEGDAGTTAAVFSVSLSGASDQTVSVDYATQDGSAQAGSDYSGVGGTLVFAPGETTKTVTVLVNGDTLDEPDESYLVALANPQNAGLARAQGAGTIVDDDPPPSLSIADVSLPEGDTGTTAALFTVSLSAPSGQPVSVDYASADGSALAGSDYSSVGGTLVFVPGETTKTLTVQVDGDSAHEPDEIFFVDLANPANASLARAQATGTILNDDPLPSLSIGDVSVVEGDAGTAAAVFTVSLSAVSDQTVSVDYATQNGSALAGSDYTAAAGALAFAPGQATQTLTVLVNGDTLSEADETFTVNLANPANATLSRAQGTGTIRTDDGLPTITGFSPASGPTGTSVTVSGTSFTGVTQVAFAGVSASFHVSSVTTLRATVPATATSGLITVTNAFGTAVSATSFTVTPKIAGFNPKKGRPGTSVTISGSGFIGATQVTFGGMPASYTVVSESTITATVPARATTGLINVTTAGGTATSKQAFTVT